MPVYEYRCKSCGKTHEIQHGFNDERPTKCPSCQGPLVRVFHPVGVVFKGSGFHKNDYTSSGLRKEPANASAGSETAKADGKATETKSTESKSSETKTSESKTAPAKTDTKPSGAEKPAAKGGDSPSSPGSSKT
jgi:putative FmdB family regulatory protein